jgi:ribosome-binding factor A
MGSKRNERLKELFLHEISQAIRNINGINANGILTLTGSELTKDSKILHVFYSVLGTDDDRRRKALILAANAREIRSLLFKRLCLKNVPELVFKFDDTPEKASHIEDLFRQINSEDGKKDANPGS